jgi:hypothetical protein
MANLSIATIESRIPLSLARRPPIKFYFSLDKNIM